MDGKNILVKIGDSDWIPAKEADLNVEIFGPTKEEFFRVWDTETLKQCFAIAVRKEHYEDAGTIHKVLKKI